MLKIVSSEKLNHMKALGAELVIVPSEDGRTTKKLILAMIEKARELSSQPHTLWTDQLQNTDSIAGYHSLADKIWEQTDGKIDAFVHSVGTGASSRGVIDRLRAYKHDLKAFVFEPAESALLTGGEAGPQEIEGVGVGFIPPLWKPELIDGIIPVSAAAAEAMTRRLAKEDGLFASTSSGANVIAAIEVGKKLGPDAVVVTLMVDSGLKYLSTDVYRD